MGRLISTVYLSTPCYMCANRCHTLTSASPQSSTQAAFSSFHFSKTVSKMKLIKNVLQWQSKYFNMSKAGITWSENNSSFFFSSFPCLLMEEKWWGVSNLFPARAGHKGGKTPRTRSVYLICIGQRGETPRGTLTINKSNNLYFFSPATHTRDDTHSILIMQCPIVKVWYQMQRSPGAMREVCTTKRHEAACRTGWTRAVSLDTASDQCSPPATSCQMWTNTTSFDKV